MKNKKILIRAGLSPLEQYSVRDICRNNRIGSNVGNLLYAFSLFRHLMTDEQTQVVPDYYRPENNLVSEAEIDRINQEMDLYIIPMADAFRKDFEKHLRNLTAFIRKLRIPAVLIGAGATARLEGEGTSAVASREAIQEFLKALLDHSACLGLRGEYTLAFLKDFGLREEADMTPIGCPSVYTFGPQMQMRDMDVSSFGPQMQTRNMDVSSFGSQRQIRETKVSSWTSPQAKWIFTNNIYASDTVHRFLRALAQQHENHLFIPQRVEELRMLYFGKDMDISRFPKNREAYPVSLKDPFYAKGKAIFPLTVPDWLSITEQASFAIGPRLHGSIACLLSGVPTIMIARDQRMREVAAYHQFPCLLQTELEGMMHVQQAAEIGLAAGKEQKADVERKADIGRAADAGEVNALHLLEEIVSRMDFHACRTVSASNFAHYLDFLERNSIEHIDAEQMPSGNAPLDQLIKNDGMKTGRIGQMKTGWIGQMKTGRMSPVESFETISPAQKLLRQIPDARSAGAAVKKACGRVRK